MTPMKPLMAATAIAMMIGLSPALAQDTIKPVKLMTVADTTVSLDRIFYGKVVARQSVDLAFQVGGQLIEFPAIEGEVIAKGELIAQLDQEQYSLAMEQALLQKDQADRTLARLTKLQGQTVSQVKLDDAQTQASLADIAVRKAEFDLDHTTLYAPFDALVATRNVGNFVTLGAGTPVVRLHDMSEIRIDIDVPEVLFQSAGKGGPFTITARFPSSDSTYLLEIREFNAEASAAGQTYRLTLGMQTPSDLVVLPGSSVDVLAHVSTDKNEIIVPATAIATGADGSVSVRVYEETENGQGIVKSTLVDVKPAENGAFVILSGLSAGQQIVAAGANRVADGQTVRPFTGFAN